MVIQIEAFNINTGGAKNLLIYLIKQLVTLPENEVHISLKDKSLINNVLQFKQIRLLPSGNLAILKRFTHHNRNIFYFGNLPPFRISKNSLLYIHNEYLTLTIFEILKEKISFKSKLKLLIQNTFIWLLHRNVENIAVQTKHMADRLSHKLKREILILPFFEEEYSADNSLQKVFDFCYVGLPSKHKNHEVLIAAINGLIRMKIRFSIALTVPHFKENTLLISEIESINKLLPGCIINYGMADKQTVNEIYSRSRALIFPSKKESLGLPIIEALQHKLRVISSDKEFSHELVNNPIVFDPDDVNQISGLMKDFMDGKFNNIRQSLKIKSHIDTIISLVS
jgi:glycosyltransferase involved in cell wall biosynthesis